MLDNIRKQTASLGSKLIFAFLALVFVFWAGGQGVGGTQWAAKVNGEIIPLEEFQYRFQNEVEARRDRAPGRTIDEAQEAFIMRSVFDSMVETELLVQGAKDLGFVVSPTEVRDTILEIPGEDNKPLFKNDAGEFVGTKEYTDHLGRVGLTPERFERRIERALMRQKMESFIRDGVKVTPAELWEEYQLRSTKVNVDFVRVHPRTLAGLVQVTDAEVETWRTANEAAVQAHYDKKFQERYLEAKRASIRRITINKPEIPIPAPGEEPKEQDTAALDAAEKKANEALAAATEDFNAAATKYSEGPAWEREGVPRTFMESQLEGPIADQIFGMTVEEPPALVETPTVFVIVSVDAFTDEKITPLDAVANDIARELLLEEKGKAVAEEWVASTVEKLKTGSTLEGAITGTTLQIQETGKFTRQREPTAIGGAPEGFMAQAFALTTSNTVLLDRAGKPFKVRDSYLIGVLKDREDGTETDFNTQKESLSFSLAIRKQGAAYRAWRQEAQSAAVIKANKDLNLGT